MVHLKGRHTGIQGTVSQLKGCSGPSANPFELELPFLLFPCAPSLSVYHVHTLMALSLGTCLCHCGCHCTPCLDYCPAAVKAKCGIAESTSIPRGHAQSATQWLCPSKTFFLLCILHTAVTSPSQQVLCSSCSCRQGKKGTACGTASCQRGRLKGQVTGRAH